MDKLRHIAIIERYPAIKTNKLLTQYNMDEFLKHSSKKKKSDLTCYILHGSIYMTFSQGQNHRDREHVSGCQGRRWGDSLMPKGLHVGIWEGALELVHILTMVGIMQLHVLLETRRIVYSREWILLHVTYISINLSPLQKKTSAQVVLPVSAKSPPSRVTNGSHGYPGPNSRNLCILPFHGKRDFVDEIQLGVFFISLYLFIWLYHV